jgi:hypothetical protein
VRFDDITYRPIDVWPGALTSDYSRRRAPFSSEWYSTMRLLERELEMLGARGAVFQVALEERDFRIDGKPRAQAKATHPGVILAFESKYGPIKFAVDTFTRWQDNVRAIALSMEALRKVDRYGVTKRGEQYTGWRAIPQTTSREAGGLFTRQDAVELVAGLTSDLYDASDVDGPHTKDAVREAIRRTHPDRGGDAGEFQKVLRARELLAV